VRDRGHNSQDATGVHEAALRSERRFVKYARLGNSGLVVSQIGLGMMSYGDGSTRPWHVTLDDAAPIVQRAVDAGVIFFDTADMYSGGVTEEITGQLLKQCYKNRDEYVLSTKVYYPMGTGPNDRGLSRKHLMSAIDASLRRLGTDYVDLYQVHRWDDETPIEETMAALHDVVQAGKARYIGASSMSAWQFAKAQHAAERAGTTRLICMQNYYNLLYREEEREMIPLCLDQGVAVTPYSPLARGRLARGRTDVPSSSDRSKADPLAEQLAAAGDDELIDELCDAASERGLPPAQLALAWLLARPAVVAPIIGATKSRHIDDAVAALDVTITETDADRLGARYRPHPLLAL
jgi:aryl-alcohol dehydrogenase-like predicted oxidoreductase